MALEDHHDVIILAGTSGRIEHGAEQQQFLPDEALPHLHLVLRDFRNENRIALPHQEKGRMIGQASSLLDAVGNNNNGIVLFQLVE